MQLKAVEIRDRATFIPVIAIRTDAANEAQRFLLQAAGYAPSGDDVILVRANANGRAAQASYDPYSWGNDRTMGVAHDYIRRTWDRLADGDVIDVEFILGETSKPKTSERGW